MQDRQQWFGSKKFHIPCNSLIWWKIIHCISLLKVSIANGMFDEVCNIASQPTNGWHHFEHLHKPVIDPLLARSVGLKGPSQGGQSQACHRQNSLGTQRCFLSVIYCQLTLTSDHWSQCWGAGGSRAQKHPWTALLPLPSLSFAWVNG